MDAAKKGNKDTEDQCWISLLRKKQFVSRFENGIIAFQWSINKTYNNLHSENQLVHEAGMYYEKGFISISFYYLKKAITHKMVNFLEYNFEKFQYLQTVYKLVWCHTVLWPAAHKEWAPDTVTST